MMGITDKGDCRMLPHQHQCFRPMFANFVLAQMAAVNFLYFLLNR